MKVKKLLLVLLALVLLFSVAACKKEKGGNKQELTVCVGPDPQTLDPALNSSVDGAIVLTNAFAGLYGYVADDNGAPKLVAECAKEIVAPTALDGGKYQYVVTLKDGLKWSDGSELKASDFVYAWKRAADPATAADYCYMFDVIDGFSYENDCNLNVVADNAAKTITIVTNAYCAYFDQLLAFPTYYPVKEDLVKANANWANDPKTYVSNGPFKMADWTVGSSIVFVKNENYWAAEDVKLEKLTYFLSDDDDAIYTNYTNGSIQYTTTVPVDKIPTLKADASKMNKTFFIGDYIGTYYLEFNVEKSFAPEGAEDWSEAKDAEVRYALGLLIDRNYIVNSITAAGQQPADGFVPAGMGDGNGNIFREEADPWWSIEEAKYNDNVAEAVQILDKYYEKGADGKYTNFPAFEYSCNPTSGNVAIATAIQDLWAAKGINCTLDQRTWAVIQTALTDGDFTISRLGWIADYDDPVNFLEIFVSGSGNNHPHLGKEIEGGNGYGKAAVYGPNGDQTWDKYDELIAAIKTEADPAARAELLYEAEEWVKATYTVIPLYYYTNPYLVNENLEGYLYSSLGWVSFKNAYIK